MTTTLTEPGGASEVGAIVGYLRLNREDWVRGVRETEREADSLGRLNPDIHIGTNARAAAAELEGARAATRGLGKDANDTKPFVVNLWAALSTVAPAAVPIAAVAGGALLGLIPVAATVALGVSGISDQFKSGALQAGRYGDDIQTLQGWLGQLKTTAASGLLSGVDKAVASSGPLMGEFNREIGVMSTQIGNIAGNAAPALLAILQDLNPLFVTFGQLLSDGASHLEHWATSSDGVSNFVAYVQAELPHVMSLLGSLITLFAHLAEGAAPIGSVIVDGIGALANAINSLPVGVLQTAIPLAISLYVALKAYAGINAIVRGVSRAVESMQPAMAAGAAKAEAASLATQAAYAEEAASVARAKLAEAQATEATAVATAVAVEGTSSVLALGATAAAEASIEFAAAMKAEAAAATLAAEEIAAAAAGAAEASTTAGRAAAVGWSSMLGPIGAAIVGVGILAAVFMSSSDAESASAKATNDYTQALITSKGAIDDSVRSTISKQLADQGLLDAADKAGIKVSDLTDAVLGNDAAMRRVKTGLDVASESIALNADGTSDATGKQKALQDAVGLLSDKLGGQSDAFNKATRSAKLQLQAMADNTAATDTHAAAQAKLFGLVGKDGVDAYLKATKATADNAAKTREQALAFQLANDGGSLLAITLDKLSGKKLSYQQTLNAFQNQLVTGGPKGTPGTDNSGAVASASTRRARAIEAEAIAQTKYNEALKAGKPDAIAAAHLRLARAQDAVANATAAMNKAQASGGGTQADTRLKGLSAAAVQNRADILGLVQSASQAAEAYGKMTGSTEAGRQKLIAMRKQLIDSRVALGENRGEVTAYVDSILTIPKSVPPTKLDIEKTAAEKKISDLKDRIDRIKQGKEPHLDANSREAQGVIRDLQKQINDLTGKTVYLTTVVTTKTEAGNKAAQDAYLKFLLTGHYAAGGDIAGNGPRGVDSVPILAAPGEWMATTNGADVLRSMFGAAGLAQINLGRAPALRMPASQGGGGGGAVGRAGGAGGWTIEHFEQTIVNPVREPVSVSGPAGLTRAAYAVPGT